MRNLSGPVESAGRSGLALGAEVACEPPEDLADGAKIQVRRGLR